MKFLYNYFTNPFTKYPSFLITIFLLITISGIYLHTVVYTAYSYAVYLFLHGFLIAYTITFILSLIPLLKIRQFIKTVIIIFLSAFFIPDFYCVQQLHTVFDADFATLLLATDTNEALEFMQSMVPLSFILLISLIFCSLGLLAYTVNKCLQLNHILASIPLFFVFLSVIAFIHNPLVWKNSIEGKIAAILTYDIPNDLKDYYIHPALQSINTPPHNIVVIMGESLTKHHCSIYGYEKSTNPLLTKYLTDSSLFVFKDVTSAGLTTMGSFTYMMSEFSPKLNNNEKKWYEYITINDVLKQANYQSHWFSNHSNVGVNNNVTRLLATACDDYHFCGNQLAGDFRTSYDEDVIKLAKPVIEKHKQQDYHYYFFHLMGSHFKFDYRYPKEFSLFSEKDYLDYPEHQRSTLASYDNSVLYNDSIVYEIMSLFKDKEAIVLYLSDHGLDLFYSSDNYAAHGIHGNPISTKYGSEIPLLIFTSNKYKELFPNTMKRIKESLNKEFRTDNLMYFIMDLMGVKFTNNNDVKQYSPLN